MSRANDEEEGCPLNANRRAVAGGSHLAMLTMLVLAGFSAYAQVAAPPRDHLGVATCASGVCHGKVTPVDTGNVRLDEYRRWSTPVDGRVDRHSVAYDTLGSDESREIARKLGLPSAQTAKICLDCHADNVTPEQRGPEFQLSDGVGCEACHGGAELWIASHTEPGVTHQDNLARGMNATESAAARAGICLSCHLGSNDRLATHRILAAGHPRLRFELESSSVNQPAHYDVDDDYRARKGGSDAFDLWLAGQVEAAARHLSLIKTDLQSGSQAFPELAFYDCHACHHPMEDRRWKRDNVGPDVAPGTPRLQRQHLLMLEAAARAFEPATADEFRRVVDRFVVAGGVDAAAASSAADALLEWIDARKDSWASAPRDSAQIQAVRRQILSMAAAGRFADQASAEQAFLAVDSLTLFLGANAAQRRALDRLFETVEEERYRPAAFESVAADVADEF